MNMNTYKKYCPNVYVAQCEEQHERGDEIIVTTRYGKENECIVHNFLGQTRDGKYLYSITRADGLDAQEYARRRADRIRGYQHNATKRSNAAWEASNEGADFLSLAEPIKVGHHSEKRHRALIERNHRRMDRAVAEMDKADSYEDSARYWEARENVVNLSMPDSLDYFTYKLEKARKYHAGLKDGTIERSHDYSLTYARKEVKELEKKVATAERLWGGSQNVNE